MALQKSEWLLLRKKVCGRKYHQPKSTYLITNLIAMQDKLKWSFELESWLSNVLNSISDLAKPVLIDTDSNELKGNETQI